MWHQLILLLALVLFTLAALKVGHPKVDLVAAGLALYVLSIFIV